MNRLSYRFGPLERRGILGPVRAGQAAILAGGALLAIFVLDRAPSAAGVTAATVLISLAVVLGVAPVATRTLEEWLPVLVMFALRRLSGRARFRSSVPRQGFASRHRPAIAVPPALRGVEIREVAYRDHIVGAISERGGRWLTAVLACRVAAFSLLDADAQERRLARWGVVLSGAAGTTVRRYWRC